MPVHPVLDHLNSILKLSLLPFLFMYCNYQVVLPWKTGSCVECMGGTWTSSNDLSLAFIIYALMSHSLHYVIGNTCSSLCWTPPRLLCWVLTPSADLHHGIITGLWSEAGRVSNDWTHQKEHVPTSIQFKATSCPKCGAGWWAHSHGSHIYRVWLSYCNANF